MEKVKVNRTYTESPEAIYAHHLNIAYLLTNIAPTSCF